MPNVKTIMIFQADGGYGWTETHWLGFASVGNISLPNILLSLKNLASLRANILGSDCVINALRASYNTPGGIASLNQYVSYPGASGQLSGSQNDSLALQMYDGSNTRKKIIHLRGMWGSVISRLIYNPTGQTGKLFMDYLKAYISQLTRQPYGWVGKSATASVFGPVTGYVVSGTDGTITFQVQAGLNSAPLSTLQPDTTPRTFECRFTKINGSKSTLNRSFVVTPVLTSGAVTGLKTVGPVAAGPFTGQGKFNISVGTFIPYALNGEITLGERRMGKALNLYPGRARRRPVN